MTVASISSRGLLEATEPPEYRGIARDAVRMLVTDRETRSHRHARFYDLPALLRPGDLLVVNDSATLPAALRSRRRDGSVVRLHVSTKIDERLWLIEPRGPVEAAEILELPSGANVTLLAPSDPAHPRTWYATFALPVPMYAYLAEHGTPIAYAYVGRSFPLGDYQTFFARTDGSSEMPSAGRPFTEPVVARLGVRGVEIAMISLHCGVASFEAPERPGTERFEVSHEAAERVNAARREGRRVIAVGTTVVRALESASTPKGVAASRGWTDLYIDEAYRLKTVDALLSGFHDRNATHLAMLRAFIDPQLLDEAYAEAVDRDYYYHEFGDVHLVL